MTLEEKLIQKAQRDPKHFAELYKIYYPKIYPYVKNKISGDKQLVEDITSETFEKALRSIKAFKWQGIPFSAWLFRIASNSVIDYYRKKKPLTLEENNLKDKSAGVEESNIIFDSYSRVIEEMKILPPREREVLEYKFFEGYTNKAIADKLGLSETNVSTIIYRSLKTLRGKLMV